MLIGVDFDNTIICYDAVFHAVALERGLIEQRVAISKRAVRDDMRARGLEDAWTELQGYVYGCRLNDAKPFPGVIGTLCHLRDAGHELFIISHKTRHPYAGPSYDLHRAALDWLEAQRIAGGPGALLHCDRVSLELTLQAKLARIGKLGCDHFIDDLPEFLEEPSFPSKTQRWLFDPSNAHVDVANCRRIRRWHAWPIQLGIGAAA